MAKRPALTNNSFLAHLFKPSKNPLPTGLRKTTLKPAKGRKAQRVTAYNKLSAAQQEVLKRAGQRDAYLKGETTLAKAKTSLRATAVAAGVVGPVRVRKGAKATAAPISAHKASVLAQVQRHLRTVIVDAGKPWNQDTSNREIEYLEPTNDMLDWDHGQVAYAGREGSEYETFVDGAKHNPFWYH